MLKVSRTFESCSVSTSMKRTMLHAGWLTKSPPERKTQGPWRFFKSQWRRRYFVLSSKKASNTLPGSCPAELEYFENEKHGRRKGRINLDNCEKVVIHMESEYYKHVFVIKTTDRGRIRTYYLAADNEWDMERWVEQLRSVLNLQDEGQVPFSATQMSGVRTNIPPTAFPVDLKRIQPTTSYLDSATSPPLGISDLFGSPPITHEDYVPINQCNSGPPVLTPRVAQASIRVVTIKSPPPVSPNSLAPLHPVDNYYNITGNDSLPDDDVYNYPKPYNRDSDVYKVPSSRETFGQPRDSDIYKIPPTRNGSSNNFAYDRSSYEGNRDSNYDYPPPKRGSHRDSNYDYPPGAIPVLSDGDDDCIRPIWECESKSAMEVAGDTYDIIPPRSNSQHVLNGTEFSSLPPPPRPPTTLDDVYDIPGRSASQMAPPKGHKMPVNVHRYINAAPTPVGRGHLRSLPRGSADEGLYLPMGSGEAAKDTYMPMDQMDKLGSQTDSLQKRSTGVLLPPPAPHALAVRSGEVPLKAPMTLPRSSERASDQTDPLISDQRHLVDSFRGTQRTRSFRRNIQPPSENVSLPLKTSGAEDSSSDEEDEESVASSPVLEYINLQNVAGSDLESPAVSPPPKPVVQYLDLDLESTSTRVTSSTSTTSSETQSKIEYNEIDMERTKALFDAKLTLEKERKGSEKSDL